MKSIYINLDNATHRREAIEVSFNQYANQQWTLERIEAVTPAQINVPYGKILGTEAGCFSSHLKAMQHSFSIEGHVAIFEDDMRFCEKSFNIIDMIVNHLDKNKIEWDMIYLDLIIKTLPEMLNLLKMSLNTQAGSANIREILGDVYTGASAYIVNQKSKRKVYDLLQEKLYEKPVDDALMDLIHQKKIIAKAIIPFPVTIGHDADTSQIRLNQDANVFYVLNNIRRLIWAGRNDADTQAMIDSAPEMDITSIATGKLVATFLGFK